jgi:hypothetical protein
MEINELNWESWEWYKLRRGRFIAPRGGVDGIDRGFAPPHPQGAINRPLRICMYRDDAAQVESEMDLYASDR